jgi:tRNA (guanine-N7-)-methyltransferase
MRVRQHVNPLKSGMLEPRRTRLPLPDDREIEVEIGCADAQFLFERAAQARDTGVTRCEVGLEIRQEFIEPVTELARERNLDVRAFFSNVSVDLPYYFAPGQVARFFINFPDPYFKRKQHKRRVMADELVEDLHAALAPGGELFFQSDVWELALDAMDTIEAHEGLFRNEAGAWSFWKKGNPYGCRSQRETGAERDGLPVWRMLYRRIG